MNERQTNSDLSNFIAENFGANATYVEGLLNRFRSDPSLVDESWRAYFTELLGESATTVAAPETAGNGRAAATTTGVDGAGRAVASAPSAEPVEPGPAPQPRLPEPAAPAPAESAAERLPIRGAALKIVENMEESLSVPTATSQRRIPVKV
ncbi:MAG TPA: hypothetical protein VD966_03795, partial [Pyrinomonadaceae bacterium]|nr:hypothetical protein [Pyrinomonadaceae bacterium]